MGQAVLVSPAQRLEEPAYRLQDNEDAYRGLRDRVTALKPPRFELTRELSDDVPSTRPRGFGKGECQSVLHDAKATEFIWPKRDQLPRTYVNSRRLVRT